jgi:hypothetical protein
LNAFFTPSDAKEAPETYNFEASCKVFPSSSLVALALKSL